MGKEPPYTPRYSPIRDISQGLRCLRRTLAYSNLRAVAPYLRTTDCCKLSPMVDIDLIVQTLRQHGHRVGSVIPVPGNAGEYELVIDGTALTLVEARELLERDETK
jgi:hypothetical protein